jgi:TrmH family RNA methyltransferase
MEYIQSKDNGTVKHIASLQRKKFRRQYKEYIVEGWRSVLDVLPTGQVKLSDEVNDEEVQAMVDAAHDAQCRIVRVAAGLYRTLEETENGQGVLAVVAQQSADISMFRPDACSLLIDEVQDPGNLGTILRTALAAGVTQILLTKGCVDPYNAKTVRSTMSALSKVTLFEQVTVEDIKSLCTTHHLTVYATALDEAEPYRAVDYETPVLLMMGNEGRGVSDEFFALAHRRITIPMYGPIESLNLAVATGLCLFAIRESVEERKRVG